MVREDWKEELKPAGKMHREGRLGAPASGEMGLDVECMWNAVVPEARGECGKTGMGQICFIGL